MCVDNIIGLHENVLNVVNVNTCWQSIWLKAAFLYLVYSLAKPVEFHSKIKFQVYLFRRLISWK